MKFQSAKFAGQIINLMLKPFLREISIVNGCVVRLKYDGWQTGPDSLMMEDPSF